MSLTERNLAYLMAHLRELAEKQQNAAEEDHLELPTISYTSSSTGTSSECSPGRPFDVERNAPVHRKLAAPRADATSRAVPSNAANNREIKPSQTATKPRSTQLQEGSGNPMERWRQFHAKASQQERPATGPSRPFSDDDEQENIKAWVQTLPSHPADASAEASPRSEQKLSQIPVRVKRPTALLRPKSSTSTGQTFRSEVDSEEDGSMGSERQIRRSGRIHNMKGQAGLVAVRL